MVDIDSVGNSVTFTELDKQFARFIVRITGEDEPELKLAALLVSNRTGGGDICVYIPEIGGTQLPVEIPENASASEEVFVLPETERWLSVLNRSRAVGVPGEYAPLVLDEAGRLYLYRYWHYERTLAENIRARLSGCQSIADTDIDYHLLSDGIERLFPEGAAWLPKRRRISWRTRSILSTQSKKEGAIPRARFRASSTSVENRA